jgi:hypothetical protein
MISPENLAEIRREYERLVARVDKLAERRSVITRHLERATVERDRLRRQLNAAQLLDQGEALSDRGAA